MTEEIKNTVTDLVGNFVYYDRKEDEDLSIEDLNKSIGTGETTVKEIVSVFEQALKNTYPDG
jgi:hypothetical protein